MKKYIYMATTALAVGFAAPIAAQDDFAGFAQGILGMASSQGITVAFDERNVGADGSVEYVGFSFIGPSGEFNLHADWVKGVPSATTLGQVTFTLSPSVTITINDQDTGEHVFIVSNDGLTITADGITSAQDAEILNLVVAANSFGVASGNPNDPILRALDIGLSNFSQTVSFTQASKMLTGATLASALRMNYDLALPDGSEMASDGSLADLGLAFQVIADDDESNILDYLSGATTAFVELTVGASTAAAKLFSPEARIAYTGSSEGAVISVRAEDGYVALVEEIGVSHYSFSEFNIDGLPLPPFDVSLESMALKASLPTVDHGGFEEANIEVAFRNIEVSESIYSMFDPGQAITRSPINAVVNVSANMLPKVDWSNPGPAMSGNPDNIAEVQDITINEVLFTAGGAQITAEGSATVDNSGPFPFPTGKVTITAAGVQALVNGLVQMGLIPQDQAGMAMGMMMAFARPGDEADEFVSDIEFSPQGITANGVPLPM